MTTKTRRGTYLGGHRGRTGCCFGTAIANKSHQLMSVASQLVCGTIRQKRRPNRPEIMASGLYVRRTNTGNETLTRLFPNQYERWDGQMQTDVERFSPVPLSYSDLVHETSIERCSSFYSNYVDCGFTELMIRDVGNTRGNLRHRQSHCRLCRGFSYVVSPQPWGLRP